MSDLDVSEVREELLNSLRLHPFHTASEDQIQQSIQHRHPGRDLTASVWRSVCQEAIDDGDVVRLPDGKLTLPK